MRNSVCAIIITYNIDKKIIDVVNSIINQVDRVVIVDNGSNKETIKILRNLEKKEKIFLILNNDNIGISKALNSGVKFARKEEFEWILTLDHDSICNEDMIEKMLKATIYHTKNNIGIIAPSVYEVNKKKYISKKYKNDSKYIEVKECIQSGSLIKMKVFEDIGYFNEDLYIYHVDFDFCQRIIKYGFKILQSNETVLYHEEGNKVPKRLFGKKIFYNNYNELATYYITRNTIYMCKKYSLSYGKRIIKDFVYIILFDNKRESILRYWFKGLKDGILNNYGKLIE